MNERLLEGLDLNRPTRELTPLVATRLLAEGTKPTVESIRAVIKKGSVTTIQSALNDWWVDLGKRINNLMRHPTLPDVVANVAMGLWNEALAEAERTTESHRQEAENRVAEAEARARVAENEHRIAEEAKQAALSDLNSANASIAGLERTLAAETAHKNSLLRQVAEIQGLLEQARIDLNTARQESARELEKAQKSFQEQLDLAQERFEGVETHMLLEIDRERTNGAAVRQELREENQRLQQDIALADARHRQRVGELTKTVNELSQQVSRLEGRLDEVTSERDRLVDMLDRVVPKKNRRRRRTKEIARSEAYRTRKAKNNTIFEAFHDEIVERLEAGEKPSQVAQWLNTKGFEGNGATLNTFRKEAGLI